MTEWLAWCKSNFIPQKTEEFYHGPDKKHPHFRINSGSVGTLFSRCPASNQASRAKPDKLTIGQLKALAQLTQQTAGDYRRRGKKNDIPAKIPDCCSKDRIFGWSSAYHLPYCLWKLSCECRLFFYRPGKGSNQDSSQSSILDLYGICRHRLSTMSQTRCNSGGQGA